jgi:hypothetical protein
MRADAVAAGLCLGTGFGESRYASSQPLPYTPVHADCAGSSGPGKSPSRPQGATLHGDRDTGPPELTPPRSAVRQPRVRGSGSPHVARGAGAGPGHDTWSSPRPSWPCRPSRGTEAPAPHGERGARGLAMGSTFGNRARVCGSKLLQSATRHRGPSTLYPLSPIPDPCPLPSTHDPLPSTLDPPPPTASGPPLAPARWPRPGPDA